MIDGFHMTFSLMQNKILINRNLQISLLIGNLNKFKYPVFQPMLLVHLVSHVFSADYDDLQYIGVACSRFLNL